MITHSATNTVSVIIQQKCFKVSSAVFSSSQLTQHTWPKSVSISISIEKQCFNPLPALTRLIQVIPVQRIPVNQQ